MGSLAELLRAFDLPILFPEVTSLQTALCRVSASFLAEAEAMGYSADACSYLKADLAVHRRGRAHPLGPLPPPAIAVATTACSTYVKWAEAWQALYGTEVAVLDVPGPRHPSERFADVPPADRAWVRGQLDGLVATLERLTGRRLDRERLRENLAASREMLGEWRRLLEGNARHGWFNAVVEGTSFLGVVNLYRGTGTGARFARSLREGLEALPAGPSARGGYALAWAGIPCYPLFRRLDALFGRHGARFVASTYLTFASGGGTAPAAGWYDDPLDALAEQLLVGVRRATESMFTPERELAEVASRCALDGVVLHAVKSCRTTSTVLATTRQVVRETLGLPCLLLESDMVDPRAVSEAQLANRVDAFMEALARAPRRTP